LKITVKPPGCRGFISTGTGKDLQKEIPVQKREDKKVCLAGFFSWSAAQAGVENKMAQRLKSRSHDLEEFESLKRFSQLNQKNGS
jgi:hypothetical protein